jgi:hypothetical protein
MCVDKSRKLQKLDKAGNPSFEARMQRNRERREEEEEEGRAQFARLREVAERQLREKGASELDIYDLASYRVLANKHVEWIKGNGVGNDQNHYSSVISRNLQCAKNESWGY